MGVMRMASERSLGWLALLVGLIVLTVGATVFWVVPDWGSWIADYPKPALAPAPAAGPTLPPEMAPMAQALPQILMTVLGPLLEQVGGYLEAAGRFLGGVLILVSLLPLGAGLRLLTRGRG